MTRNIDITREMVIGICKKKHVMTSKPLITQAHEVLIHVQRSNKVNEWTPAGGGNCCK